MMRKIPPRTAHFYRQFASGLGGPFAYHPSDMRRFYEFVWAAHLGRCALTGADVRDHLISDGLPEPDAEQLGDAYDECRAFADARISPTRTSWEQARLSGAARGVDLGD